MIIQEFVTLGKTLPPQLKPMMWKKGVSPNPGGRPSRPETIERRKIVENVKELCKQKSIAAVNALVSVMEDATAPPSARVVAANSILDRAFGKPQVTVEATITSYDTMSERELIEYIAGRTIEGEVIQVLVDAEGQPDDGDEE